MPLLDQALTPIATAPFHFVPAAGIVGFGPYQVPPGLVVDAIAFDFTGGVLGCIANVQRLSVQ